MAVVAAAPFVSGQAGQPTVHLSVPSGDQNTFPGADANFTVTVTNQLPLGPRTLQFESTNFTPGWTWNADPRSVLVQASGQATAIITLTQPNSTVPGDVGRFEIVAKDSLGQSDVLFLNVTVVKRDEQVAPAPAPPQFTVTADPASGTAGSSADGILHITNGDRLGRRVSLGFRSDPRWNPRFVDSNTYQVDAGTTRNVQMRATIPADTPNGTVKGFFITANTDDGLSFDTVWNVTALAPASSSSGSTGTSKTNTSGGSSSTTSGPSPSTSAAPLVVGLEVVVSPQELLVAPGEASHGTLRLRDSGTVPLSLELKYQPPTGEWSMRLDAARVELAAGETKDIGFTITAPLGVFPGGTATATIQAIGDGLVRPADVNMRIVPVSTPRDDSATDTKAATIAPAPTADPNTATVKTAAWLALGVGTVGAAALVVANRPIREKLIWASVGLYTRLAQPDILGHPERDRLYKIVEAQPGIHFHALQRDLGWNTGTLTYHLRVLERHQFIVSRRDGPYRRFFKVGVAPRKETFSVDAPQGLRADVLEAIRNRHGISQSDLALALGANKQTVNYHVKALERQGTIRVERRGRETFLYMHQAGVGPAGPSGEAQS